MKLHRQNKFFVVAASLAAGLVSASAFAEDASTARVAAAPQAPKLREQRDAEVTTTRVTWTAPSDDVTGYLYQLSPNAQFENKPKVVHPVQTAAMPKTTLSMTFSYLQLPDEAGTSYMRVQAKYATGVGPWSNVLVLKNPCVLTQAPTHLQAKLTNAKDLSAGVDLVWKGGEAPKSCPPVEYYVEIKVNGPFVRPYGKVNGMKLHLASRPGSQYFLPDTTYTFQVCAVYERWIGRKPYIEEGPLSAGITLTTPK